MVVATAICPHCGWGTRVSSDTAADGQCATATLAYRAARHEDACRGTIASGSIDVYTEAKLWN